MTAFQIIVVLLIIFMGRVLEHFERQSPNLFWGLLMSFLSVTLVLPLLENNNISTSSFYTKEIMLDIRAGSKPMRNVVTIETGLGKRIKIDIIAHRRLENFFPDWEERIAYQENREKVYQAAIIKRREALKLRQNENFGRTEDEQDAMDYFSGKGLYQKYQDPSVKPNIFDTRLSFLIKVHNKEMKNDFLDRFNRQNTLIP